MKRFQLIGALHFHLNKSHICCLLVDVINHNSLDTHTMSNIILKANVNYLYRNLKCGSKENGGFQCRDNYSPVPPNAVMWQVKV